MTKRSSAVKETVKKPVGNQKAKTSKIKKLNLEEQLAQREAELQIINSIQQGLAAELNFQAIVDLVGDKLRDVFNTTDLVITWIDEKANLIHYLYAYEHGERLTVPPRTPSSGGIFETMQKARQPIVLNSVAEMMKLNALAVPGTDQSKSAVYIPIVSSDRLLGIIQTENYERENAFGESELRLLTTIAASLGTALENARLFDETQRLLKETEQRNAELAVINSVQEGVAASLDFQTIIDLVGDKLREVLHTDEIGIRWYDEKQKLVYYLYEIEHGKRLTIPPAPPQRTPWEVMTSRREPRVINTAEEMSGVGLLPGTEVGKSSLSVDIPANDKVLGSIIVENYEKEYAFGPAEVRLLTTVASSMGVALENARLFDETQRLFKAEQERAAELQIINSIQQGLAAELDFQAIVDLVGDKLREVFQTGDIGITRYDEKTNILLFHLCL